MSNRDISIPDLDLEPDYSAIGDRQPGLMLSVRPRNGKLRRPFMIQIYGLGACSVRELTVEDMIALRDQCVAAIDAIYAADDEVQEAAE